MSDTTGANVKCMFIDASQLNCRMSRKDTQVVRRAPIVPRHNVRRLRRETVAAAAHGQAEAVSGPMNSGAAQP
jgi:hypothetical protein